MAHLLEERIPSRLRVPVRFHWPSELVVSRTPASFKKVDVVRLIKAAREGGVNVTGLELTPDGTLRVLEIVSPQSKVSDFDRWEAEL